MGNPAGVRRDFEALERRRMRAAELLRQGVSQSEVARRMGVHRQSVIRWARQLARSGRTGLKKAGRAGRKPRLSAAQLKQIEQALKRGPETLGYASGLWTAGRVRELIEHQCGVRYHEAHVWRILRRLGWSCQRPTGRALERDEKAIRYWKRVRWPQLKKKALRARRTIIFIDESGLNERPHRVRTWAPRGHTPVLQYHFNWHLLSALAGITWWNFYFRVYVGTIHATEVIDFLGHLLRHLPGKLLVVWDGLPQHRARLVTEFIRAQRGRLAIEWLPAYAPELNPVEYIWGYWKQHELPNFCPHDFAQLSVAARRALKRMRRRPSLLMAFWQQAELFPLYLYYAGLNRTKSNIPYIKQQVGRLGYLALTSEEFQDRISSYLKYQTGIGTNTLLMTVIAFIVGLSISGQTFYTFILENLEHFGALKAIGAKGRELVYMILFQAAFTSLAGYGLGIGLFTLLITAAKLRLPEYASRVTYTNLGLAFLMVLIIASVSSYAGIR